LEARVTESTSSRVDGRSLRAEAQRESRRAEILSTAETVFAAKGYHGTRISDIIDAAGIARGTFYLYFESKQAIFLELIEQLLAELRSTVVGVETTPGAPPIQDQLVATVSRIVRAVTEHKELTRILLREAVGLDAEVDQKLSNFYLSLHDFIRYSLENGKRLGLVRDVDTDIVASCILGSIKYLLEERLMQDAVADPERIGRAVLDYNLRGVLA
jgi:AcrR family transcriptional regulator